MIKITINGKIVEATEGETVLEVAERNGFFIPALCCHSDLKNKASCRLCLVEVEGKFVTSCNLTVRDKMEVKTKSTSLDKARKINLELLFSQHREECGDCVWNLKCKMLDLAKQYGVKINRFNDRKKDYPVYQFGPSLEFDSSKCIDCRNCVEVCKDQGVEFLEMQERKGFCEIIPSENRDCVYCGQCIIHCPAGAFEAVGEFEESEKAFEKNNEDIILQIAPAVRSTIGEEFNLPYGSVLTEKLSSGLKEIGADKVFDVSLGADITTIEESKELFDRIEKKSLPMMTSCCPAWVRFVELYYPNFIPHLTTVRSPHIILGGLIKESVKGAKVVSVMPCVAKKYEIEREELMINGEKPVDYVLTTREVGRVLKRKNINLKNIKASSLDVPFGEPSSSGVCYGMSGGVMKSAIKNATGEDVKLYEKEEGIYEGEIIIKGEKRKVAVVHGLGKAKKILEELKKDKSKYDYLEVMACKGGCIGGGGQSIPVNKDIREKRKKGLQFAGEKKKIEKAEDNEEVKKIYKSILKSKEIIHRFCHTNYYKAPKRGFKKTK